MCGHTGWRATSRVDVKNRQSRVIPCPRQGPLQPEVFLSDRGGRPLFRRSTGRSWAWAEGGWGTGGDPEHSRAHGGGRGPEGSHGQGRERWGRGQPGACRTRGILSLRHKAGCWRHGRECPQLFHPGSSRHLQKGAAEWGAPRGGWEGRAGKGPWRGLPPQELLSWVGPLKSPRILKDSGVSVWPAKADLQDGSTRVGTCWLIFL